jgi:predicted HicB family RNase H-like nuclease
MKAGRPRKSAEYRQTEIIPVRVNRAEKESFQQCADLAGVSLSSWVRERLRMAAIHDLERAGRPIPFVEAVPIGGNK